MDVLLEQAIAPVMRDLVRSGIAPPRLLDYDWLDDTAVASAMLHTPDGAGTGITVSRLATEAEQVAWVADAVQEAVIDYLMPTGPNNWPPCPLHPRNHPLLAAVHDEAAVWECPKTGSRVAAIGAV
ncbi:hypothetical protein INN71_15100 [Nocardioides sp. ChNu-153]|uniref:hypothetical protein n=1 Tax=Nocardioides sp. ChNu-153 TaxID=2779364 RepID=UPI00265392B3|nr:hypothetical protein [Nocardioides sp. ChNu-153]MDN7122716.1 hypothetical protein [Nocardioides sp. ChNu-153]